VKAPVERSGGQRENLADGRGGFVKFQKSGHVPGRAKRMTFLSAHSLEA
jgi:hypothetical protein